MSPIMPAGAKRYNWIPKLADDEKLGTELLDLDKLTGKSPVADAAEAVIGKPGEVPAIEAVEVAVEGEKKPEGEAKPEGEKPCECKEKVQELADKAQEVAAEAQELVELVVGDDGTVSMPDIPEIPEEVSVEIEEEPATSETSGVPPGVVDEAAKEGESVEEEAAEKVSCAAAEGRFVKIAALTPENKKKLKDYWANVLGYDKKYVEYMVTDYEK